MNLHTSHGSPSIKLSICITTLNRSAFIGITLQSILAQATDDCEIVVVDGASTDETERVVTECSQNHRCVRYIRQDTNGGLDRDFDRTVALARGEYCWLMADDDLLKPGAIAAILTAIERDHSLVLVNAEHKDLSMSKVLVPNFFGIDSDRHYGPGEMDRLFQELGKCLICICCVVIKRAIWLERKRTPYYGSMFLHVGVIFQQPLPGTTLALAEPLLSLRWGNEKTWLPESFGIFYVKWPALIWSFPLSTATKEAHCMPEPWLRLRFLLPLRAMGSYRLTTYRSWIRPRLRSVRESLSPTVALLLPVLLIRSYYALQSQLSGVPNALEHVLRRHSMLPESLDAVLWPDLPKR